MGIRDKPIAPASPWQNYFCRTVDRINPARMVITSCLGEAIYTEFCEPTHATTTSERIGHWTKMRRFPWPVQRTGSIISRPILGAFFLITITFALRFSVHTGTYARFFPPMQRITGSSPYALASQKDAPLRRAVQSSGAIVAIPILAGLHHQYVHADAQIGAGTSTPPTRASNALTIC